MENYKKFYSWSNPANPISMPLLMDGWGEADLVFIVSNLFHFSIRNLLIISGFFVFLDYFTFFTVHLERTNHGVSTTMEQATLRYHAALFHLLYCSFREDEPRSEHDDGASNFKVPCSYFSIPAWLWCCYFKFPFTYKI